MLIIPFSWGLGWIWLWLWLIPFSYGGYRGYYGGYRGYYVYRPVEKSGEKVQEVPVEQSGKKVPKVSEQYKNLRY
jgi:hypothetical protein